MLEKHTVSCDFNSEYKNVWSYLYANKPNKTALAFLLYENSCSCYPCQLDEMAGVETHSSISGTVVLVVIATHI